MERQTDRQTDIQTDVHAYTKSWNCSSGKQIQKKQNKQTDHSV